MGSLLSSVVIAAMAVIPIWPVNQSAPAAPPRVPGETRSLLADGTWLVLGGEAGGRPTSAAAVEDPATGTRTPLGAQLRHARAWHTATTLPD